ncbi:MAG: hypothetical protein CMJ65_06450 [Planctomycetaceae bacterium]|nr:hypothetical protein [Planctomycetaceae bacterium]
MIDLKSISGDIGVLGSGKAEVTLKGSEQVATSFPAHDRAWGTGPKIEPSRIASSKRRECFMGSPLRRSRSVDEVLQSLVSLEAGSFCRHHQ